MESKKIICRHCAGYHQCKSAKKNTAVKCRNFWEHIPTSEFTKNL